MAKKGKGKKPGRKAVNYFRWLYSMGKSESAATVAFNVAKHKGEQLPLGRNIEYYINYCIAKAPPRVVCAEKTKKGKGKKVYKQKGRSALGFKNLHRQPGEWVSDDEYNRFYRSTQWRELRYLALKNTDGRCECCGASAKDGAVLHVDHIQPRASRPDLQLSLGNVQVLCADCNIGKGAWDDTDWRSDAAKHMDEITKH